MRPASHLLIRLLVLSVLIQVICLRQAAHAAPSPHQSADSLRQEGQQSLAVHDLTRAQQRFEEAFKLEPIPDALYALGQVAQAQGEVLLAADFYRRYLDAVEAEQTASVRDTLLPLIETQRERGGEVTVRGDSGALVIVDRRLSGVLPLSLPLLLSPGEHTIELAGSTPADPARITVQAKRHVLVAFVRAPSGRLFPLVKESPAVLLLPLPGKWLPADVAAVRQAVRSGLIAEEKAVLVAPDAQAALLRRLPNPGACVAEDDCLASISTEINAKYVVQVTLQAAPAGTNPGGVVTYRIGARLFDVAVREWSGESTETCEGCAFPRAMEQLRDLTSALMQRALNQARGVLAVTSQPSGANVQIDGHPRGRTPYEREAWVGVHRVVVDQRGYVQGKDTTEVLEGKTVRLHLDLQRETSGGASTPHGAWRAAQWTLLGLGAATIALGATLWGLDGYQNCDVSTTRMCPLELDSRTAGIALTAGGGAMLITSVALIAIDRRRGTDRRPHSPTAIRAGAMFQ